MRVLQPVVCIRVLVCVSKGSGSIVHKIPRSVKDNLLECRQSAFSRCRRIAGDGDVGNQLDARRCAQNAIQKKSYKKKYVQSATTNSCEQKTMRFHHHVRPSRLSDPSREPDEWEKPSPTFLPPLRRSEGVSSYRIYHIHVYFSKHTEIRSTLR